MPSLSESLQGRDLGHLRIVAEFWGIELVEQDPREAISKLTTSMLYPERVEAMVKSLSPTEHEALIDMAAQGGRILWAQFTRTYGEVREMGVAKRDRERPYEQPISAAEALWYRGLFARAFFDTASGPEEFAYIPDDLLVQIAREAVGEPSRMGRPASAAEYTQVFLANDRILDHACTLLAAFRMGKTLQEPFFSRSGEDLTPAILKELLATGGLIGADGVTLPEPVRVFLEADRGQALARLFSAWRGSVEFNELLMLPGLSKEGNWLNDPLRARKVIMDCLRSIPTGTWWSLQAFVAALKKRKPDFQRLAGDYDAWFIRDTQSGKYLRGFEHWDEVDGRLVRFILTGPLHWFGVLDLACTETVNQASAFRLSGWSKTLLGGEPPKGLPTEEEPIIARSDAALSARRLVPRRVRYQLARFCEWGKETPDDYQYQVTAQSLKRARKQGLTAGQLVALLKRYARGVPPSLVKALERWEKAGSEARLEQALILRVTSVEVLEALRKSRASRFLGEPLGPNTVIIKPGAAQKVLAALAELGYLGEIRLEEEGK